MILKGKSGDAKADRGAALAGKSTLNRLELRSDDPAKDGRYKKIALDEKKVDDFFIDIFLQAHEEAPKLIVIDLDATDDPLHGKQEGRFFHGYYRQLLLSAAVFLLRRFSALRALADSGQTTCQRRAR